MSKKRILQGIIAGMAAVSIMNVGSIKDVKAETVLSADIVNANFIVEDNSASIMSTKKIWCYKDENGKRYMRLYDATNRVWLTDWILCG